MRNTELNSDSFYLAPERRKNKATRVAVNSGYLDVNVARKAVQINQVIVDADNVKVQLRIKGKYLNLVGRLKAGSSD
jgi:hypothetical protein